MYFSEFNRSEKSINQIPGAGIETKGMVSLLEM